MMLWVFSMVLKTQQLEARDSSPEASINGVAASLQTLRTSTRRHLQDSFCAANAVSHCSVHQPQRRLSLNSMVCSGFLHFLFSVASKHTLRSGKWPVSLRRWWDFFCLSCMFYIILRETVIFIGGDLSVTHLSPDSPYFWTALFGSSLSLCISQSLRPVTTFCLKLTTVVGTFRSLALHQQPWWMSAEVV